TAASSNRSTASRSSLTEGLCRGAPPGAIKVRDHDARRSAILSLLHLPIDGRSLLVMSNHGSARVRDWRHELHQCPETGFAAQQTSDVIARVLSELGLQVERGIGGTGVVASLRLGDGPGAIGLRADMDGLPLPERGEKAYASRNDGVMHACGHDGHMAMVLGAA